MSSGALRDICDSLCHISTAERLGCVCLKMVEYVTTYGIPHEEAKNDFNIAITSILAIFQTSTDDEMDRLRHIAPVKLLLTSVASKYFCQFAVSITSSI
jgi:hypothetical protein